MKKTSILLVLAVTGLAACGKGGEPQGQVAATVDGKEITVAEVNAEASGLGNGPGAQGAALNRLIMRQLLVNEARSRKLDKAPQTAMLIQQAQDSALIQALNSSLSAQVPKVSDDEVAEFIRNNPANTTRRQFLFVDQLLVPSAPASIDDEIRPLHTLAAVEALLGQKKLAYRKAVSMLDTRTMDPQEAKSVSEVGTSDIFFARNANSISVSAVAAIRGAPLEGEEAKQAARDYLTQQRVGAQLRAQVAKIAADGKAKVKVNPAYEAKKPAK